MEEGLDILGKGKKKSEEIAGGEKLDEQSSSAGTRGKVWPTISKTVFSKKFCFHLVPTNRPHNSISVSWQLEA